MITNDFGDLPSLAEACEKAEELVESQGGLNYTIPRVLRVLLDEIYRLQAEISG
jgi:hypothetical protein